jgi:hypothetical protein
VVVVGGAVEEVVVELGGADMPNLVGEPAFWAGAEWWLSSTAATAAPTTTTTIATTSGTRLRRARCCAIADHCGRWQPSIGGSVMLESKSKIERVQELSPGGVGMRRSDLSTQAFRGQHWSLSIWV